MITLKEALKLSANELVALKEELKIKILAYPELNGYIDITELIEIKEADANEKERLSLTLKSIAEGVVATDSTGSTTLIIPFLHNNNWQRLGALPCIQHCRISLPCPVE